MSRQHPSDKLSAAVDGELDHDSRDKVLSHLVGCDSCRADVEAERRLKARLGALGDDLPEPPAELMQRLLGVPSYSAQPREEVRPVPTPAVTLGPQRSAFPAGRQSGPAGRQSGPGGRQGGPAGRQTGPAGRQSGPAGGWGGPGGRQGGAAVRGGRSRRRAGVLGAAGSAAAVASLLGTAFVLGDPARQEQPPLLQPPVSSFSADHASTANGTPFADPVSVLNAFSRAGYSGFGPTLQPVASTGR